MRVRSACFNVLHQRLVGEVAGAIRRCVASRSFGPRMVATIRTPTTSHSTTNLSRSRSATGNGRAAMGTNEGTKPDRHGVFDGGTSRTSGTPAGGRLGFLLFLPALLAATLTSARADVTCRPNIF